MRTILAALLAICAFSAHAEPVTCTGEAQCAKMWADAQQALTIISNMRIRLLTPDRVETFAPNGYSQVGATLVRMPTDDGYKLLFDVECYVQSRCADIRANALELFANFVRPRPQ